MSEKLETRSIKCSGLQVRKAGESDKPAVIEGYAMRFDEESVYLTSYGDKFVEIMDRQCYSQEKADKTDIKMTLFHNREKLLARSDKGTGSMTLTVDDQGLKFSFEVPDTEFGKFAEEAVRRGDIKGCSIGFMTNEYDTSTRLNDAEKDTYDVVVRQKDIEIFELTLESDPAYPSTSVELRGKENVSEMLEKQKAADADALYLRKLCNRIY